MRVHNHTSHPSEFLRALLKWTLVQCKPKSSLGRVGFHFAKGPTYARWAKSEGGVVIVHVQSGDATSRESAFQIVTALGEAFAAFGGAPVPEGDLGRYRQPVGEAFTQNADALLVMWQQQVPPKSPTAANEKKVKVAKDYVALWERRMRLAANKVKTWRYRLRRAEVALKKKKESSAAKPACN